MIMSKLDEFAAATSVIKNAASTDLIGDVIDLGKVTNYPGNGDSMWVVILTSTEIITGGGTGSCTFTVESGPEAAITTSPTVHLTTATFVTDDASNNSAALNAGGTILAAKLPGGAYQRYLGIRFKPVTENITAGAINAFLCKDLPQWVALPDGI